MVRFVRIDSTERYDIDQEKPSFGMADPAMDQECVVSTVEDRMVGLGM